jgi:hypothetical protein
MINPEYSGGFSKACAAVLQETVPDLSRQPNPASTGTHAKTSSHSNQRQPPLTLTTLWSCVALQCVQVSAFAVSMISSTKLGMLRVCIQLYVRWLHKGTRMSDSINGTDARVHRMTCKHQSMRRGALAEHLLGHMCGKTALCLS